MKPLLSYFNNDFIFKQCSEVSPLNYDSENVPVHGYGGLESTVRTQQDTTHQVQDGSNGGSSITQAREHQPII